MSVFSQIAKHGSVIYVLKFFRNNAIEQPLYIITLKLNNLLCLF